MVRIPPRETQALACLVAEGVRFVLVGGQAVLHHGGTRDSSDVDLFVDTPEPNPTRVYRAIVDIIGTTPSFQPGDLGLPGKHIRFKNDGVAMDALTSAPGLEFDEVWNGSVTATVGKLSFPVIGRPELLKWLRAVAETYAERRSDALRDIDLLTRSDAV